MYRAGNSVEQVFGGTVIKQGDRTPLGFNFRTENGELVYLTGSTVQVKVASNKGVVLEKQATISDEYTAQFAIGSQDITGAGDMRIEFIVTYPGGTIEKFPSDDWQRIRITPTLEDVEKYGVGYITFEKLTGEFQNQFDEFKGEVDQQIDGQKQRVDNLINSTPQPSEIVDARFNVKNKKFDTIKQRIDNDYNEVTAQLANVTLQQSNAVIKTKKLDYMNVSLNANNSNISLLNNHLAHLKFQNAKVTLITNVSVNSTTDSNPIVRPSNYDENNFIIPLINNGIGIEMLKPHIGINFADTDRSGYTPSDYSAFFTSWTQCLLFYAALCDKYNIPCLCIGCEQADNSKSQYANNWKTLCDTIRTAYPNLKLVYASTYTEFNDYVNRPLYQYVDYIGVNLYVTYWHNAYSTTLPTPSELAKSLYMANNNRINYMKTIGDVSDYYNKPVFITETGCTPSDYGLVYPLTPSAIRGALNFDVSSVIIQTVMEYLGTHRCVYGVSWWSTTMPYSYYDENSAVTGVSAGEVTMKNYFAKRRGL